MKQKHSEEFDEFDKVMDGLLSVPYSKLQKKLGEEKADEGKEKEASYLIRQVYYCPT
jgi:hypothetical protein